MKQNGCDPSNPIDQDPDGPEHDPPAPPAAAKAPRKQDPTRLAASILATERNKLKRLWARALRLEADLKKTMQAHEAQKKVVEAARVEAEAWISGNNKA